MALSVVQLRSGPTWPLGYINVATPGTPAGLMSRVDANNTSSPTFSPSPATPGSEYTIRAKSIFFYGYHPGNNNNGMVPNEGYVYVNWNPSGNNAANRTDSGSMVGVIPPGGGVFSLPQSLGSSDMQVSPYSYTLDADTAGEGAMVVLVQPQGN